MDRCADMVLLTRHLTWYILVVVPGVPGPRSGIQYFFPNRFAGHCGGTGRPCDPFLGI
jgi:hypothetical protein